jgi:hypothetical protein
MMVAGGEAKSRGLRITWTGTVPAGIWASRTEKQRLKHMKNQMVKSEA